jgi:Transposase Tn5 dimerisation domain/Transposase DNA-binding
MSIHSQTPTPEHESDGEDLPLQDWVRIETADADFGDERLNGRYRTVLDRQARKPSLKFNAAARGNPEVKAAYRFVDNEKVDEDKVLDPHRGATIDRIRDQRVVIVGQDTTELDVTRPHEVMTGAGPLNDPERVGLFLHALLAVTPERLPLGTVHTEFYARDFDEFAKDAATKRAERRAKPIEEKESLRWLEGYRAACRVAEEAPGTTIVIASDSEGDIFECLAAEPPRGCTARAQWIIRACQDRAVSGDDPAPEGCTAALLRGRVAAGPVLARMTVEVRPRAAKSGDDRKRKQSRTARKAEVAVRAARVCLRGPSRPGGKLADATVNVVLVREESPPEGAEPIEWILLTSLPIGTVEEVLRVIEYYCCRWQIEIFWRVLKSGCKVEESQLEEAGRFRAYVALCLIVSWRVMYVMMLGREYPELPCDVAFDEDEWQSVYAVVKGEAPPAEPPTMGEMVRMVASLGGFLGRKGDGEPGPKAMWVGMQRMTDLSAAWRARARHAPSPRRSRDRPGRISTQEGKHVEFNNPS